MLWGGGRDCGSGVRSVDLNMGDRETELLEQGSD